MGARGVGIFASYSVQSRAGSLRVEQRDPNITHGIRSGTGPRVEPIRTPILGSEQINYVFPKVPRLVAACGLLVLGLATILRLILVLILTALRVSVSEIA
jgi:hypothetical protein